MVLEITRPNGRVIYATDDPAIQASCKAAGRVVVNTREMQCLQRAVQNEENREVCIDTVLDTLEIFQGSIVGGRKA